MKKSEIPLVFLAMDGLEFPFAMPSAMLSTRNSARAWEFLAIPQLAVEFRAVLGRSIVYQPDLHCSYIDSKGAIVIPK